LAVILSKPASDSADDGRSGSRSQPVPIAQTPFATNNSTYAVMTVTDQGGASQLAEASPLIRIQGVALSADNEPVRYTVPVYCDDRFCFMIDATEAPGFALHVKSPGGEGCLVTGDWPA
jgi:hypothetical protein